MPFTTKLTGFQWDLLLFVLCGDDPEADTTTQRIELDAHDIEDLTDALRQCDLLLPISLAAQSRPARKG